MNMTTTMPQIITNLEPNQVQTCVQFDKLLLSNIDKVFNLLGPECKQKIYQHLHKNCNIEKEEIPRRIDEFSDALETIFGNSTRILEINIMKMLHQSTTKIEYIEMNLDLTFSEYVKKLRRKLET